jgi:predicted HTH transcriptional regulator
MGLLDLLKRPEGKRLEFKRDLSSPDGALKTIMAFANTAGGTLLLGMENHSRNVHGVANPLDEEELLANLTSNPALAADAGAGPAAGSSALWPWR